MPVVSLVAQAQCLDESDDEQPGTTRANVRDENARIQSRFRM